MADGLYLYSILSISDGTSLFMKLDVTTKNFETYSLAYDGEA